MKLYITTGRGTDGKPVSIAVSDDSAPALKAYEEARASGKFTHIAFFSRPLATKRQKFVSAQEAPKPAKAPTAPAGKPEKAK